MEDIKTTVEDTDTTEVNLVEPTTVLVREYVGGKNVNIEDNVIHCTYEYVLPSSVVMDSDYIHTDNNFTDEEKAKLASLKNADLTDYYTKEETDAAVEAIMDNYYTKQEVRTMILQDLESYYTKDEVDTKVSNYYTKEEVQQNLNTKEESILDTVSKNYYNKTEVDQKIASGGGGGGASTASEVSITDLGGYFTSNNVEGALQELAASLIDLDIAVSEQSGVVA